MNSTWLIAPSSRLRLAMRNPACAASARASAVRSESIVVLEAIERLLHLELHLLRQFVALGAGALLGRVRGAQLGATAAAVGERPVQQQRQGREIAAAAELVVLPLGAGVGAERERRLARGARDVGLRAGGRGDAVELRELGPVLERGAAQRAEVGGGARDLVRGLGRFERGVEVAVQQEVEVAARLRLAVLRLAQLLVDGEQFCSRAQHLILGDLAVAEQRVVDPQVLGEQRAARVHDLDGLRGLQPAEVADGDVALQAAREREARIFAALEQRALAAHGGGDRRRIQRLAQRQARVLFALAEQVEPAVLDLRKLRGTPAGSEQLVQRAVDGVQQVGDRQLDLATTFGTRIARLERGLGEEAAAGSVERGLAALDLERGGAQAEVGGQAGAHVGVDDFAERAAQGGERGRLVEAWSADGGLRERRRMERQSGDIHGELRGAGANLAGCRRARFRACRVAAEGARTPGRDPASFIDPAPFIRPAVRHASDDGGISEWRRDMAGQRRWAIERRLISSA